MALANKLALIARSLRYLVAIMDWFSRKALSWRLSNTLEAAFRVEALEEAFGCHAFQQ